MVGVFAATVIAGPAAGGAAASVPHASPSASVPAVAAAPPTAGSATLSPAPGGAGHAPSPAAGVSQTSAAAPSTPAPAPSVPPRPLGGAVPGLMSSQEAKQQSADAPYKFEYGPVFVHIDPRGIEKRHLELTTKPQR